MPSKLISVAASLVAAAQAGFEKWQAVGGALSIAVEQIAVTTEDDYVLKMIHLTPTVDNGKRPILLQHGNLSSADSFIDAFLTAPQKSIPFLLVNAGYHVYLGNNRGTKDYSSHQTLEKTNPAFYMYSHEEMGLYDVPAFANEIKSRSGSSKITYIGNSQGSNQAFLGQIKNPDYYEATFDKVIHTAGCGYSATPDYQTLNAALAPLFTLRPDIQYLYGPDWGNLQQTICALEGMATACAVFPDLQPIPEPLTNYYEPLTLTSILHYSQNFTSQQFASRYEPFQDWNGTTEVGDSLSYKVIDKVPQYYFVAKANDDRCPVALAQAVFAEIGGPKSYFDFDVSAHNDFVLKPEITINDMLDVLAAPDGVTIPQDHYLDVANSTKLIGRISYQAFFDPWVNAQFATAVNVDEHPCAFEWKTGKPFESSGDMRQAIHISHNCPKELVDSMTFTTTLTDGDSLSVIYHTEPTRVVMGSNVYVSTLTQPKTASGDAIGNDDAFLLGTGEPNFTYAYQITLA